MKREEKLRDLLDELQFVNDVEVMKDGNDEDGDSGGTCPTKDPNS